MQAKGAAARPCWVLPTLLHTFFSIKERSSSILAPVISATCTSISAHCMLNASLGIACLEMRGNNTNRVPMPCPLGSAGSDFLHKNVSCWLVKHTQSRLQKGNFTHLLSLPHAHGSTAFDTFAPARSLGTIEPHAWWIFSGGDK